MRTDSSSTAAAILPLVGGPANVTSVAHCMTRLRLVLTDPSRADEAALRALPGVLGVVVADDAYQVVLGPGVVTTVTAEFEKLLAHRRPSTPDKPTDEPTGGLADRPADGPVAELADELGVHGAELRAARRRRNATPLKTALRRVAAVFVPLIPALIGCGILAGLNGLLLNAGWLPGLTPALAAVASAFMSLIAVFVGYQTAKEFGGTPILGGAVAAIVVYPGVAKVTAFGVTLAPARAGSSARWPPRCSRRTSRSGAAAGSRRAWTCSSPPP